MFHTERTHDKTWEFKQKFIIVQIISHFMITNVARPVPSHSDSTQIIFIGMRAYSGLLMPKDKSDGFIYLFNFQKINPTDFAFISIYLCVHVYLSVSQCLCICI